MLNAVKSILLDWSSLCPHFVSRVMKTIHKL